MRWSGTPVRELEHHPIKWMRRLINIQTSLNTHTARTLRAVELNEVSVSRVKSFVGKLAAMKSYWREANTMSAAQVCLNNEKTRMTQRPCR